MWVNQLKRERQIIFAQSIYELPVLLLRKEEKKKLRIFFAFLLLKRLPRTNVKCSPFVEVYIPFIAFALCNLYIVHSVTFYYENR